MKDAILELERIITPGNVLDPEILDLLRKLTISEREQLSFKTKTRVVYLDKEVPMIQKIEELAALRAKPKVSSELLNGLSIGGNRIITNYLNNVNIFNEKDNSTFELNHRNSIVASFFELPFKNGTIDYIIALHTLGQSSNPISTLLEWFRVLKPGGGIGVILPDWRYNWDASNDHSPMGQRWNSTPMNTRAMLDQFFMVCPNCVLEYYDTYSYKISFDFVLRKEGNLIETKMNSGLTGYELSKGIGTDYIINYDGSVQVNTED